MVDNLRRSLTPIFWVMATVAGWTLLPFAQAAQWQALLILALFMAPTFDIVDSILPKSREATARGHFTALARDAAFGTALVALRVVLMAHNAWMMGDAIVRTLYRMFVSRQNLLEWRTASQAHQADDNSLGAYYSLMYGAVIIALIGLMIPVLADSTGAFVGFFFFLFWAGSPAFAWLISRSAETEDQLHISAADTAVLRTIARRTWAYFETFVTAEHNHLPPDNFQETPHPVVAPRTSPTNIGVYFLSIVSARDFGWISLADATARIDATLSTIEKMERHRGHLFNWYETTGPRPLYPLYVSRRRQRQSRRPSGRGVRRLLRMGRGALGPPAGRLRRHSRLRHHPRREPRRNCPTTGGSSGLSGKGCSTAWSACAGRCRRSRRSPRWRRSAPSTLTVQASEIRKPRGRHRHRGELLAQCGPRRVGGQAGGDLRGACAGRAQRRPGCRRAAHQAFDAQPALPPVRLRDGFLSS